MRSKRKVKNIIKPCKAVCSIFWPVLSDIRQRIAFCGSQASPACPSDNNNVKMQMMMCMEHWWYDTDR